MSATAASRPTALMPLPPEGNREVVLFDTDFADMFMSDHMQLMMQVRQNRPQEYVTLFNLVEHCLSEFFNKLRIVFSDYAHIQMLPSGSSNIPTLEMKMRLYYVKAIIFARIMVEKKQAEPWHFLRNLSHMYTLDLSRGIEAALALTARSELHHGAVPTNSDREQMIIIASLYGMYYDAHTQTWRRGIQEVVSSTIQTALELVTEEEEQNNNTPLPDINFEGDDTTDVAIPAIRQQDTLKMMGTEMPIKDIPPEVFFF